MKSRSKLIRSIDYFDDYYFNDDFIADNAEQVLSASSSDGCCGGAPGSPAAETTLPQTGPDTVRHFDMPIWYPTDENRLDKLLNAEVKV